MHTKLLFFSSSSSPVPSADPAPAPKGTVLSSSAAGNWYLDYLPSAAYNSTLNNSCNRGIRSSRLRGSTTEEMLILSHGILNIGYGLSLRLIVQGSIELMSNSLVLERSI